MRDYAPTRRTDLTLEQSTVVAITKIHSDSRYLDPILQVALNGLHPPGEPEPAEDNGLRGSPELVDT